MNSCYQGEQLLCLTEFKKDRLEKPDRMGGFYVGLLYGSAGNGENDRKTVYLLRQRDAETTNAYI